MKRKPNLSFILTMLSTLVVAAAVMFTIPGSAQAATSSGQKVVKLTVDRPTDVGGATLQPGKYSVKIMQSSENSSDPTLQLSHTIYDPYVEEGLSPYGEEVVVTVSATTQDLGAPAASTELTVSSAGDNRARGLEIRGNNIEYVFETTATAGANGQWNREAASDLMHGAALKVLIRRTRWTMGSLDYALRGWVSPRDEVSRPSASLGRVKWKLAPRPELTAAHKRPPWDSIIERLIGSPIPVPWALVVKNALKICSDCCGGNPIEWLTN